MRRLMLLCWLLLCPGLGHAGGPILILGDSLSAGYGLRPGEGWVELLDARLQDMGSPYAVINASISGESSSGGRARLDELLQRHQPSLVVVELGANDGLQGRPLELMRENLQTIILNSREAQAKVLLLGMELPINFGRRYRDGFRKVYADLAAEHALPFVPFLLADVALQPGMLQADGLHPTAQAQPLMLDAVWPSLLELLDAPTSQDAGDPSTSSSLAPTDTPSQM